MTPPPQIPDTPTPWTRWRKNQQYQQELATFLAGPTGTAMLEVLRYLATPLTPAVPEHLGDNPLERRAMQYSEMVGYHQGLQNMISLSIPAAQPTPLPRPWQGRAQQPSLNS
jgi:hypothetical protein